MSAQPLTFRRAVRSQVKARIGLLGPAGSGKTYTALLLASGLGKSIALIDSERGSASNYAHVVEFDSLVLDTHHPQTYIDAIRAAGNAGYEVLIIDSLSHAWAGVEGALELVDKNQTRYSGNKFAAWRDVTPLHNQLVDAILAYPGHVIATMRSKTEYVLEEDSRGKKVPKKVGMAPIQRDGMEYEFGLVAEMDMDHNFVVTKTRYDMFDSAVIKKPGKEIGEQLLSWLNSGEPASRPMQPVNSRPEPVPTPDKAAQPRPAAGGNEAAAVRLNWKVLWPKVKQLGLSDTDVYAFAAEMFSVQEVTSLTEVVKTQDDINRLTSYIENQVKQQREGRLA